MRKFTICACILYWFMLPLTAQDFTREEPVKSTLTPYYLEQAGVQSGLFNGTEYLPFTYIFQSGRPSFASDTLLIGHVHYNGMQYFDVPLMLDLVRNQLVTRHITNFGLFTLVHNKIKNFTINNHFFINLQPEEAQSFNLDPGFYDILYQGKIDLWVKRKYRIEEFIESNIVERKVVTEDRFFVLKDKVFIPVNSRKSVFNTLGGKKSAYRSHLRKEGIRYRKEKEPAILSLIKFHDQTN